ncbi:MAG: hypothetical protein P1V51_19845 [Deltaproteobacteria bacterium]|nr:hypothetical protein [Deltaproteobacteria bacterium]
MKTDVKIRLTEEALDALFPVGTVARAELERSVVKGLARGILVKAGHDETLSRVFAATVAQEVQLYAKPEWSSRGTKLALTDLGKIVVREEANRAADETVRAQVREAVATQTQDLRDKIQATLEVEILNQVKRTVRRIVDDELAGQVGKIKAKLHELMDLTGGRR